MRKDIIWEPFFFLAFHLKLTNWRDYYHMPVRLRNWLIERTVEEYKTQQKLQEENEREGSKNKSLEGMPQDTIFKAFDN